LAARSSRRPRRDAVPTPSEPKTSSCRSRRPTTVRRRRRRLGRDDARTYRGRGRSLGSRRPSGRRSRRQRGRHQQRRGCSCRRLRDRHSSHHSCDPHSSHHPHDRRRDRLHLRHDRAREQSRATVRLPRRLEAYASDPPLVDLCAMNTTAGSIQRCRHEDLIAALEQTRLGTAECPLFGPRLTFRLTIQVTSPDHAVAYVWKSAPGL
jgi:hypothetical protein